MDVAVGGDAVKAKVMLAGMQLEKFGAWFFIQTQTAFLHCLAELYSFLLTAVPVTVMSLFLCDLTKLYCVVPVTLHSSTALF